MHLAKVTYAIQTNSVGFNSGVISEIFMALKEQTVLQVYVHEIRMQCPIACMKSLRLRFPAFSSVQRRCRRSWCAFAAFERRFGDSVPTAWRSCFDDASAASAWRASMRRQMLGCLCPIRCWKWLFHASEVLFVRSVPRIVASCIFHVVGGNRAGTRRSPWSVWRLVPDT